LYAFCCFLNFFLLPLVPVEKSSDLQCSDEESSKNDVSP
jgi:hypothetical protein